MPAARILLVDDHDVVRLGLTALIAAEPGWEVCAEARTGREAVSMAAELHPDLVIMDILMPDLNGLDAARRIKKAEGSPEILLLSGHEDGTLIQPAFDAGVRAYLFKSQARQHLMPAIAALLEHKPYLTSEVSEVLFREFEHQQRRIRLGEIEGRGDAVLTDREREIIQLLAEGRSNKEVGALLGISTKTIETHRASIMRKLNLSGLSDVVLYAIRSKIIEA